MQNPGDKSNDLESSSTHMKRAPSYGTVTSTNENLNWERSQSDANLTVQKDRKTSENISNISENDSVYWDLSNTDANSKKTRILDCNTNSYIAQSGFQMALETIHQNNDELFDYSGNDEADCLIDSCLASTNSTASSVYLRNSTACVNNVCNRQFYSKVETRKSCSALPTYQKQSDKFEGIDYKTFEPRNMEEKEANFVKIKPPLSSTTINHHYKQQQQQQHKVQEQQHQQEQEQEQEQEREQEQEQEKLQFQQFLNSDHNYFCDSDYDANKECIPNYQMQLKALQEQFIYLISQFDLEKYVEDNTDEKPVYNYFEWPPDSQLQLYTKIIADCCNLIDKAWSLPNLGRDYATSLCDLIRQQGLLKYLTLCMSRASESILTTSVVDNNIDEHCHKLVSNDNRKIFTVGCARLFSQVLTTDNIDTILGLSETSPSISSKTHRVHEYGDYDCLNDSAKLFIEVVKQSWLVREDRDLNREFICILEGLLKHDELTNNIIIHNGGLKTLVYSCRSADISTLRHLSFAIANLSLFGNFDIHNIMTQYKVADWLFPLAFHSDDCIKYYACLAIVVLAAHKQLIQSIQSSGTMELVLSFLQTHSPYEFSEIEPSNLQGRSKQWLERLLIVLNSDTYEAVSMASFHFVMEARIKHKQNKTNIFYEIGAIDVLRKVASSTDREAAQFCRQALKILDETLPYDLSHPVSIWSVDDVCHWLKQISFENIIEQFQQLRVDGDLLMSLTDDVMKNDLEISNKLIRMRLSRELSRLKTLTSYEPCDPTDVNDWIKNHVGAGYTHYTYDLIKAGVDRRFLGRISEQMLENDCHITNCIHRARFLNAIEECKEKFARESKSYQQLCKTDKSSNKKKSTSGAAVDDIDSSIDPISQHYNILSNHTDDTLFNEIPVIKNIDVFISYRRNNGSQLASLLMVHLRLRGYRVFLDIERLPGGKFNENLLQSIQRSRNFILVLTSNSLDRCMDDTDCRDWVHREIVCALNNSCNMIPVTDRFEFPPEDKLPTDMRSIVSYNAISWVHDYQEACVEKIEQFMSNTQSDLCKCPFSPPQTRPVPQPLVTKTQLVGI